MGVESALVFVALALSGVGAAPTPVPAPTPLPPGTTPNIDTISLGLCYSKRMTGAYGSPNCSRIWTEFTLPFLTVPQADIVMEDFDNFLLAANHPLPRNRAMFWSGSAGGTAYGSVGTVHALSQNTRRYWTLEDTLYGGLVNGLTFCSGNMDTDAFNFTTCPSFDQVLNDGLMWVNMTYRFGAYAFWPAASRHFARQAAGAVSMLVYSSNNRLIYRPPTREAPGTVFATVEIYALNASQIDNFTLMVITNEVQSPRERCGMGSLANLTRDLTTIAGIPPSRIFCHDDPDQVAHLLCVDDPTNEWCQFARNVPKSSTAIETYLVYAGYGILVGLIGGYAVAQLQLICCGVPLCVQRKQKEKLLGELV
jgi:hypothetical protein